MQSCWLGVRLLGNAGYRTTLSQMQNRLHATISTAHVWALNMWMLWCGMLCIVKVLIGCVPPVLEMAIRTRLIQYRGQHNRPQPRHKAGK